VKAHHEHTSQPCYVRLEGRQACFWNFDVHGWAFDASFEIDDGQFERISVDEDIQRRQITMTNIVVVQESDALSIRPVNCTAMRDRDLSVK